MEAAAAGVSAAFAKCYIESAGRLGWLQMGVRFHNAIQNGYGIHGTPMSLAWFIDIVSIVRCRAHKL